MSDLGGVGAVGLKFGNFAETLDKALQQLSVEGCLGWGKAVVAPQARLADKNEIRSPQISQVARDGVAETPGLPAAVLPQRGSEFNHDAKCSVEVESGVIRFTKHGA